MKKEKRFGSIKKQVYKILQSSYAFILIFCLQSLYSKAQDPGTIALNKQLRHLFSGIHPPVPGKLFLYELSAKSTPAYYWQTQCSTTLDKDNWFELYQELYHSAFDTTLLEYPDTLYARFLRTEKQVIPMHILNYDYYSLQDDAMSSNKYFEYNLKDTVLNDKFKRENPYLENSIFAAAPLDESYDYSNPTFRISPSCIFTDVYNSSHFINDNTAILKIDFDDGNGYIAIDPTTDFDYQANYPTIGMKIIKTKIEDESGRQICYSQSKIKINSATAAPVPSYTLDLPGISASMFGPCVSSSTMNGKIVIYLSGYDPMDMNLTNSKFGRSTNDIYASMIQHNELVQLRNLGYSFLVVDWKNSRIDMRYNALYLVNLLENLKCNLSKNAQQFVIMGESMGGLIARFALNYMESDEYKNSNLNPFFVENGNALNTNYLEIHPEITTLNSTWLCNRNKEHNTRLLITLDTPNQGANIPLSLQSLYRQIDGLLKFLPMGIQMSIQAKAHNVGLDGMAAKQMLIYHIDNLSGISYTAAPQKDIFFGQLKSMGNYPKKCKLVALSNGSLSGIGQQNPYSASMRSAGDLLMGINYKKSLRIFGKTLPLFNCLANFKTNPNGLGDYLNASLGFYLNLPVLSWFKIDFASLYIPLLSNHSEHSNVVSYCATAGGFSSITDHEPGDGGFFDKSCVHSDGYRFNFVPLQSALDYGQLGVQPSLATDIEVLPIQVKLAATPYSVIIGNPGHTSLANTAHLGFRNPYIYNSSISIPTGQNIDKQYFSCTNEGNGYRTLLGLEIGDEELYLENCSLNWHSGFQAEFDIHVNERNRHYEYPSYLNFNFNVPGIYSKEEPFVVMPNAFADFYCNSNNAATGIGLSYSSPHSSNYQLIDGQLTRCCYNFKANRTINKQTKSTEIIYTKSRVIPNPSSNHEVKLEFGSLISTNCEVEIVDVMGKSIVSKKMSTTEIEQGFLLLDLSTLHLQKGVYFLRLQENSKTELVKLVLI
jgi:hypothetical protein